MTMFEVIESLLVGHLAFVCRGVFSTPDLHGAPQLQSDLWESPLLPLLIDAIHSSAVSSEITSALSAYDMTAGDAFLPLFEPGDFFSALDVLANYSHMETDVETGPVNFVGFCQIQAIAYASNSHT